MEMSVEETREKTAEKISVVVPAYNAEKDIDRLVNSLLAQTYPNLEILLVDDGSTDGTGKRIDELAEANDNVFAFHQPNGGSSAARNTGIRHATGDYIAFCDSDDYVENDMYESLHDAALKNPLGMIYQILTCYESTDGEILQNAADTSGEVVFLPSKEVFHQLMLHKGDASFCTKLIRSSFMKDFGFPEGKLRAQRRSKLQAIKKLAARGSDSLRLHQLLKAVIDGL